MAVKSVENLSLEKIKDLERRVRGGGQQVVATWVKGDAVHRLRMARVVLYELVVAQVVDLECGVGAAGGYEGARWMKGDAIYVALVFVERVHAFLRVSVPQFDCLVIRSAHNQSSVFREP